MPRPRMNELFRKAFHSLPLRFLSGLGSSLKRAVRGAGRRRRRQADTPVEALEARMVLSAVTSDFGVDAHVPQAAIHSTPTTPPIPIFYRWSMKRVGALSRPIPMVR